MKVVKEEWSELQPRCSRPSSLFIFMREKFVCLFVSEWFICILLMLLKREGAWCTGRHMHALVWCSGVKYLSISRLTVSKHEALGDPCYLLSLVPFPIIINKRCCNLNYLDRMWVAFAAIQYGQLCFSAPLVFSEVIYYIGCALLFLNCAYFQSHSATESLKVPQKARTWSFESLKLSC
jgi:hypothetical protein